MNDSSPSPTRKGHASVASHPDPKDVPDLVVPDEGHHDGEVTGRDWGRGRTLRDQHLRRISVSRWTSAPAESDPSYYLG